MSLLVATSLLFTTNIVHAFYVRAPWLHHAWVLVLVTSLLYHTTPRASANKEDARRLDQLAVGFLVLIGAVYWWGIPGFGLFKAGAFALFIACAVFYAYGFCNSCFCFARAPADSKWHGIMHVAASAGHHFIMAALV